ncbi:Alginate biosynthesis protein AlgK [compost metagenome]
MYSQGKGIRPDLVNAFVFSQLALPKNSPQANALARQIEQQLQPAQRSQAEQLLRDERQVRGNAWQAQASLKAQIQ